MNSSPFIPVGLTSINCIEGVADAFLSDDFLEHGIAGTHHVSPFTCHECFIEFHSRSFEYINDGIIDDSVAELEALHEVEIAYL